MLRNPTMVLAGSFWPGGTERGLADGFRSLGWAVQEIDSRDHGVRPGSQFALRLAARMLRTAGARSYENKVLESCRILRPDVFITVKGIGISKGLLRQIKEIGVGTVMYYPDYHYNHSGVSEESFGEYDFFVTTKTFQLNYLESLLGRDRIGYVPHGYVDSIHRAGFGRIAEEEYRTDLLYSGNHSTYKQTWLEGALNAVPELSAEIIGNRWRKNVGAGVLSRCEMRGERTGVAYAQAIQSARINIAVHFGPDASGWEDLVSTRTFEIPACKGFMLHIDNAEVREFFKPGEEIDVFATPEELADKIRFYLARPDLRAEMIERAYARAVPAYGYQARAGAVHGLMRERFSFAGAGR